jgi:hypothetical protein
VTDWRDRLQIGTAPKWLTEAAEAVLADLQQPVPVALETFYEPSRGILWFSERGETGGAGFNPFERRDADLLVSLADWLQEQVFPETRAAWGEARPRCNDHSHPARPIMIAGRAWWVCLDNGHPIAPIGRYGNAT